MKKLTSIICTVVLVFSLVGCQGQTADKAGTLTGKVTAIDGTTVTLQLGELAERKSPEIKESPENSEKGENPPGIPSGNQNAGGENGTPPEPPSGEGGNAAPGGDMFTAGEETTTVDLADAAITRETAEGTTGGAFSDIAVGDILVVEMGENQKATAVTIKSTGEPKGPGAPNGQPGGSSGGEVNQGTSANTIDADGTYSNEAYTSTGDDENALRIKDAKVVLENITVNKDSGATSNTENGDFYGVNAALLATDGADVTIQGAAVNSSAQNGNGVFSYGKGTTVTISDSAIITTADNSGGIQTTGGAATNARNLQVTTSGSSSAAIRSDRGGGTVNVDGGAYISNGYNSPAIYSTAQVTVKNASLTANNSEALVIEGKNSIALEDCTVIGNMSDTKGSSSDINVHNIMIYQSMSGDADVGTSEFTMKGGNLTSNSGDMFYVTNTACKITLKGVTLAGTSQDRHFLVASGNDASHGWGNAGSNGAQVEFTADGQTFEGDIAVDSISSLSMALTNGSVYTGAVNIEENEQKGSAVEDNAVITIDSGSTWNLTGNCAVTSLTNNGTIHYNGYTITLADGTVLNK